MTLSPKEILHLQQLEESLWISQTRFDMNYMEAILHPDFFEFGRSGRIYARKDTLCGVRPQEIKAVLPLKDFKAQLISDKVVQTTYISEVWENDEKQIGNRSSIWVRENEQWQLRFHQGTVVKNSLGI